MSGFEELGDDELVLLVVGNNNKSKSQVADWIVAQEGGEYREKITAAGVRILSSKFHKKIVVDAREFPYVDEFSEDDKQQIARQWIAQNLLRRLVLGKLVSIVCVLKSSVDCGSDVADKKEFAWLDILGVIFPEHKQAIRIFVDIQTVHEDKLTSARQRIKSGLNEHGFSNPTYLDLSRGREELGLVVSCRVDVRTGDGNGLITGEREAFRLNEPAVRKGSTSPTGTAWDPERIILIGKTGSGKSTLAQMLTKGDLDPDSEVFSARSGIRGETKHVSPGQGRGWYVVDTPGFGEPDRRGSTVPTIVAEDRIKKFVETIDGLYSHFLYVVKKDRIDELEVRLWKFFVCLFGADISDHFSIVISNADEEWLTTNITQLRAIFEGCTSFLSVDFPSTEDDDEELEEELRNVRIQSLERLENALAQLSRGDVICQFGDHSKTAFLHLNGYRHRGHGLGETCQKAARLVKRLCSPSVTSSLKVDEKFFLLPF